MTAANKVTLKSSDDQFFEVDELVAIQSETVKNMIEDVGSKSVIMLPNVSGKILAIIIPYWNYHVKVQKSADEGRTVSKAEIQLFDAEVVRVDQATLVELINAANYLNIKNLLELTCQAIADVINSKSSEETRTYFNIQNDFSLEEEEAVRRKIQWALLGGPLIDLSSNSD